MHCPLAQKQLTVAPRRHRHDHEGTNWACHELEETRRTTTSVDMPLQTQPHAPCSYTSRPQVPHEGEALVKWDASGLEHTYLVGRYNLNEPVIHAHNI